MSYGLKRPCAGCPFRRDEGGVRLTSGRIHEIVRGITSSPGGEFYCHKTTVEGEVISQKSQVCAGALIFADKQDAVAMPQVTRIALRLGMFDPSALSDRDDVFDDLDEMLATAIDAHRKRRRKG